MRMMSINMQNKPFLFLQESNISANHLCNFYSSQPLSGCLLVSIKLNTRYAHLKQDITRNQTISRESFTSKSNERSIQLLPLSYCSKSLLSLRLLLRPELLHGIHQTQSNQSVLLLESNDNAGYVVFTTSVHCFNS